MHMNDQVSHTMTYLSGPKLRLSSSIPGAQADRPPRSRFSGGPLHFAGPTWR